MTVWDRYDAWLEAPYVRLAEDAEAYVRFCEEHDLDPEGDYREEFEAWLTDDPRL